MSYRYYYYTAVTIHITFVSMCFRDDMAEMTYQTSVEDIELCSCGVCDCNVGHDEHQPNFRVIFTNKFATGRQRVEKTYQTDYSIDILQTRPLLISFCDFSHIRISQSSVAIPNGRSRDSRPPWSL